MRILIANRLLCGYTGTEVVTRDLALALQAMGHAPAVYSPWLGPPAREIAARGVPVYSNVALVPDAPDVVHGNHPKPLLDALLRFPGAPAVAVCHDATSPRDEPVAHPRVLAYVAVDDRCRRRLDDEPSIPRGRILVRLNAVDLDRFPPRGPLPGAPARALVFSNNASWRTHLPAVRDACRRASLHLDVLGARTGTQRSDPGAILGQYDIVFAKARCALEALAVGAAVVLCDARGLGPMVTMGRLPQLRRLNFGQGLLTGRFSADAILGEIGRYDPADAARVSAWVRADAGLAQAARDWLRLYEEVRREAREAKPPAALDPGAAERLERRYRWESRIERQEAWWRALERVPIAGSPAARLARRLSLSWPA